MPCMCIPSRVNSFFSDRKKINKKIRALSLTRKVIHYILEDYVEGVVAALSRLPDSACPREGLLPTYPAGEV